MGKKKQVFSKIILFSAVIALFFSGISPFSFQNVEAQTDFKTPTIAFDRASYEPDMMMSLTIVDANANKNPNAIEKIGGVKVIGQTSGRTTDFVIPETGANTGIFDREIGVAKFWAPNPPDLIKATYTYNYGGVNSGTISATAKVIALAAVQQPDLIIDKLYIVSPPNPDTDDLITFNAVVKNIGDAQAPSTTLEFRIGGETPGPSNRFNSAILNPGDTWTKTRQITLNVAQNYMNTAIIDVFNTVAESDENNNKKTLSYQVTQPQTQPTQPTPECILNLNSNVLNTNFLVNYGIVSGQLFNIIPNTNHISLEISVATTSDGQFCVTLPRQLIDAKANGQDGNFFVLINGEEIAFDETKTSTARTLTFPLPIGAQKIEIIGTFVVGTDTPTTSPPDPVRTNTVIATLGSSVPGCEETYTCFTPYAVLIDTGETVTWYNEDTAAHTVSSGDVNDQGAWGFEFDSGLFMAGTTFPFTFNSPGEYPYICVVHPWMTGVVYVEGTAQTTPTIPTLIFADLRVVDVFSNPLTEVTVGEQIQIFAEVFNNNSFEVDFTYVITVDELPAVEAWITGSIFGGEQFSPGLSQIFDSAGTYTVRANLYDNIQNRNELASPLTITIQVVAEASDEPTPTTPTTSPPAPVRTNTVDATAGSSVPGCEETWDCYDPYSVLINTGDTVTWFNRDNAAHTVTSGYSDPGYDGKFDSSLFMAGTTFQHTFNSPGEFPYFGMIHPWAIGEVIVEGPTITPTTTPTTHDVQFNLGSYQPGCELTNSCLSPSTLSISVDDSVKWHNADIEPHTATSGTPVTGPDERFDSNLIVSGGTWSKTFTQAGTYDYFSMISPWVQGKIIVGVGDGQVIAQPNFMVETDRSSYTAGDTVTIQVSGTGGSENVAVSVTAPNGNTLLTRTVTTNTIGTGSVDFGLSNSASSGTYSVDGTVNISGTTLSSSDSFNVSQVVVFEGFDEGINIVSVTPTDQQGNPVSSFSAGSLSFASVVVSADSSTPVLVTVNLFDASLTPIGIASFSTTLPTGQSEFQMSFTIPSDAASGTANIYANVFTDWPSQGGTPLTAEKSASVMIP